MYRDGVLIDIDNAPENYPYLPNGYDNVVLGVPNNVLDAFGEVWIDDIVSYEHIVDDEHVKDIYLSYFYWEGQNQFHLYYNEISQAADWSQVFGNVDVEYKQHVNGTKTPFSFKCKAVCNKAACNSECSFIICVTVKMTLEVVFLHISNV